MSEQPAMDGVLTVPEWLRVLRETDGWQRVTLPQEDRLIAEATTKGYRERLLESVAGQFAAKARYADNPRGACEYRNLTRAFLNWCEREQSHPMARSTRVEIATAPGAWRNAEVSD